LSSWLPCNRGITSGFGKMLSWCGALVSILDHGHNNSWFLFYWLGPSANLTYCACSLQSLLSTLTFTGLMNLPLRRRVRT
jgi:hypothetical protein